MEKSEMERAHFVLVHGACHGAWCWYRLITLLRSNGHLATALDMAASGVHPHLVDQVHSLSDYSQPLMEFMESLTAVDKKVILVGHSLGGLCISLAMEKYPDKISAAVFVAALMPGPFLDLPSLNQQNKRQAKPLMDSKYTFKQGKDKPPTSLLFGPNYLSSIMYQLSPPEDLALATLLVRPLPFYTGGGLMKDITLTIERYGLVRRVYVICDQDAAVSKDLQNWMFEKNPTYCVKVILGSDHMPMFSQPHELCSCLLKVATELLVIPSML